jgi:hypothetical protein
MWNLSRDYGTQFNFLLLRTIDAINCLIYPYVLEIVEGKTNKYFHEIRDLFSHLDDALCKLIEDIAPDNLMVVSDHGYATLDFNVNMNVFLQKYGFQIKKSPRKIGLSATIRRLYGLLPLGLRAKIRTAKANSVVANRISSAADFDSEKTSAFSLRYIPGVYVNDFRFGHRNEADRFKLLNNILLKINSDPYFKSINLTASLWQNSDISHVAPDILLHSDLSVFFDSSGPLIAEIASDDNVLKRMLSSKKYDQILGTKAHKPFLSFSASKKADYSEKDLSAAYQIIKNIY